MSLESINWYVEKTGKTHRTIKKKLECLEPIVEGRSHLYETREALNLLYDAGQRSTLDLSHERARLAKHQADKVELEVRALRREFISIDEVVEEMSNILTVARSTLLGLPYRLTPILTYLDQEKEVHAELEKSIHDALSELAGLRKYEEELHEQQTRQATPDEEPDC